MELKNALKLLVLVILYAVAYLVLPVVVGWYGLLSFRETAWIVLGASFIGLVINTLFGYVASRDVEYHRMGLSFCGIALGAALSNGAIQLTQDENTLPGLRAFPDLLSFGWVTHNGVSQTLFFLGTWFVLSIVFGLFCAILSEAITKAISEPSEEKILGYLPVKMFVPPLQALTYLMGALLLQLYVIALVVKG